MRKITASLVILIMAGFLSIQAWAAPLGSIRISLKGGINPISGAQIKVSRAGDFAWGGYRLTKDFGGGFVSETDILTPEFAEFLAEKSASGYTKKTDKEGSASFQNLEEGLYLVTQVGAAGGYLPFEPFVITLPWDGSVWDITATPKTERQTAPMPDTSDPGIIDKAFLGMVFSGVGLCVMIVGKRRWIN